MYALRRRVYLVAVPLGLENAAADAVIAHTGNVQYRAASAASEYPCCKVA